MIYKCLGIVLHRIKYSETSVISKIYTERFGMCSFLVQGARKKNAASKANLLQPLSLVELVAYHKENSGLHKMKELKNDYTFGSLQDNIAKSTIALFLSEMMVRSIVEETPNKPLFNFLYQSVKELDSIENPTSFHLLFLVKLSKFLGFFPHKSSGQLPQNNGIENSGSDKEPEGTEKFFPSEELEGSLFFDLPEGNFVNKKPAHTYYLNPVLAKIFLQLIQLEFADLNEFFIERKNKKFLLEKIIDYYRLHISGLKEIKSYRVLEEVMMG